MICICLNLDILSGALSERAIPISPSLQFSGEWQERDILRPLNRDRQPALVPRASAGYAAR
jgi:hypothetical protein